MKSNRWVSLPFFVGGCLIISLIVVVEVLQRNVPVWFICFVAFPFVMAAAIFHPRIAMLITWAGFVLVYLTLDAGLGGSFVLIGPDSAQWVGLLAAGLVVEFISSERSRAVEISGRRLRELEAMSDISQEISSELELNRLLQKIVHRAVITLDASLGELLLLDRETGGMDVVVQFPVLAAPAGFRGKPGEGAMGEVAATKKPLIVNDYKTFAKTLPDEIDAEIEAIMGMPLLKGGEFIGVLGVFRYRKNHPFTDDDLSLLSVLANQATIAIQNARLYQEVQHLAYTDALTGLNNRRRLFELAEKEYRRAVRYQRPLSILLMDIDHFKIINDRYGHVAGDAVLKWLAGECSAGIRQKVDIIGRFGGEEFAILYPETGLDSAIEASVRVRNRLLKARVDMGGETVIRITMSMGIASLPSEETVTLDQLVERADKALYSAKELRNCIAYWDGRHSKTFRVE